MADAVIGRGYLQVVPKMDKGALDSALSGAGASGSDKFSKSFSDGVSAKAVAIGNIMASALTKGAEVASQAAKRVITGAFNNYAEFEQLSGGVQKIFDDMDNSRIFKDAGDAWRELNMSANDYLATINDVGAMFSATMGDEAAYDAARRGMQAISDYSSGTGKNLDLLNEKFAMITRATSSYQSIADQFAGILPATSADFLEQAQAAGYLSDEYGKLTEVPVADYQRALVSMLEDGTRALGLQGNTAAETEKTISGSIAGMKAAWENWLTGLADENADMGQLTDNLVHSVSSAIDNALPRLQEIVGKLGPAVTEAISGVLHNISPEYGDIFDRLAESAGKLAEGFGHIIEQAAASGVLDQVATAIDNIADSIANADFGPFFEAVGNIFGKINEFAGFIKNWQLEGAMENGGMFGELTDPSTWHVFDANVKNFQSDLEALGGSVKEYGKLSDATMRQVADAYRTNGNDMEAALASAGLKIDEQTGKLNKLDQVTIHDKTYYVDDGGTLYDQDGKVVGLKSDIESIPNKNFEVTDNGSASASAGNVDDLTDSIGNVQGKTVDVTANVEGASDVFSLADVIARIHDKVVNVVAQTTGLQAAGGFLDLHASGGFVTDGPTYLGRDANGVGHIAGEAGREWVMRHADGTTSIVPIENKKYLKPYADTIASMVEGGGRTVNVQLALNYDAGDDAMKLARDVSNRVQAYLNMGV